MEATSQWVSLRELLSERGDLPTRDRLYQLLADWQEAETLEAALDYAKTHTERWDQRLFVSSFRRWWPDFPEGAPAPCWHLVRTCTFPPRAFEGDLLGLLKMPALRQVTHLGLGTMALTDDHIGQLLQAPQRLKLETLVLDHNGLSLDALERLTRATFPLLQSLSLRGNALGPKAGALLAKARWRGQLHALQLADSSLTDKGLLGLSQDTYPSLTRLSLANNTITDKGAQRFWRMGRHFPALTHLSLHDNLLTEACLTEFKGSAFPYQLKRLWLASDTLERAPKQAHASKDLLIDIC